MRADERGMGRYVRTMLRSLAARADIALTLLVRDVRDADAYRAIAGQVDVAALSAARRRGRYDAVWYPWNGIRFPADAPAVVTINDDFAFRYPARGPIARLREQRPVRRAVTRADRIVTISHWSQRALAERFGITREKIAILPLRPDPYFTPGAQPSPFREPFVLAVGASEPRKHVGFLAGAFARAFPAGDVRLVIVGTPPAAVRAMLAEATFALTLHPRVDDAELRRLYRTAALVAVPSLAEGFGLVVAEAQACGAPVVAANRTALPEAAGDAGVLLDPHDAGAWQNALRELVRDPIVNERYRERSRARWAGTSHAGAVEVLLAQFERAIGDRA